MRKYHKSKINRIKNDEYIKSIDDYNNLVDKYNGIIESLFYKFEKDYENLINQKTISSISVEIENKAQKMPLSKDELLKSLQLERLDSGEKNSKMHVRFRIKYKTDLILNEFLVKYKHFIKESKITESNIVCNEIVSVRYIISENGYFSKYDFGYLVLDENLVFLTENQINRIKNNEVSVDSSILSSAIKNRTPTVITPYKIKKAFENYLDFIESYDSYNDADYLSELRAINNKLKKHEEVLKNITNTLLLEFPIEYIFSSEITESGEVIISAKKEEKTLTGTYVIKEDYSICISHGYNFLKRENTPLSKEEIIAINEGTVPMRIISKEYTGEYEKEISLLIDEINQYKKIVIKYNSESKETASIHYNGISFTLKYKQSEGIVMISEMKKILKNSKIGKETKIDKSSYILVK